MPAVSDTSAISNLAVINRLDLLENQFRHVFIPPAVSAELAGLTNVAARRRIGDATRTGWLVQRSLAGHGNC